MFDKVLIANRGEIACRIIATCRRLGIASVAVYSDADAEALHVRQADAAWRLGPAAPRESYLDIERVIAVAQASGAQAIHPGYGFLAENPQLAERAALAGLTFIGPPVSAMQAMASKATARELMRRSGVPVLPGYQGERQGQDWLREQAARIGYPVLIKAAAGGGGKGMRAVYGPAQFDASLQACQREAGAAFGDSRVVLEKYLDAPRHIEVQVFGDADGHIVHLYERDCSAQRRHQKVIEEAPAAHLREELRAELTAAACEAARAVGYMGAGTVEFLLDDTGAFYFIEMNTRIQVEHAVTEMITGVDLVEWQLRVAAGEALPLSQEQIRVHGHAIEARVYAESPANGFLPSSGRLRDFRLPPASASLRLESGVTSGDVVGIDYDPLLAKLVVHADERAAAVAALHGALGEVRIAGVSSNLPLLRGLTASAAFRDDAIDTEFIERRLEELLRPARAARLPELLVAAAALWTLEQEAGGAAPTPGDAAAVASPWQRADGWRLNGVLERTLQFEVPGDTPIGAAAHAVDAALAVDVPPAAGVDPAAEATVAEVRVQYRAGGPWLTLGAHSGYARLRALGEELFEVRFDEQAARVRIYEDAGTLLLEQAALAYRLRRRDPLLLGLEAPLPETNLAAPMPGRIIAHLVRVGEIVPKGAPLLIMEAMKMEHALCAPAEGSVRTYRAAVGAQVQEGAQLIDFEPRR